MNIEIFSKHLSLNEGMKSDIERKFLRLERFLKSNQECRLRVEIIKVTGEHHRKGDIFDVEARIDVIGGQEKIIKAGKTGESILSTCDKVKEEIERQLLKSKARSQANKRKMRRVVRMARGKI